MRKRRTAAALFLAASMLLSACGSGVQQDNGTEAAAETAGSGTAEQTAGETAKEAAQAGDGRRDIIAANSSDIQSMDPAAGVDSPSAILNKHIYNGLTKIDENKEVVGDLAESFEMVDDVTYKFKLREGVKFHNGEELKASDVKFTLERCKTMPKAMSNASAIDHVTVEGDYDLTVHLNKPYPSLQYILNDTSMKILSEKAVTEAGESYGENPVGTGPFKFKEWVPNDHWTLERFDDYFDGPAEAASITMRIIPEGSARCIALETGEIDLTINVDPTDAVNIESNPDLMLESHPSSSVEYLALNTQKEALSDVRVRQAIAYALNRQEFVDTIVEGRGEVANSFIAKTIPGWNEDLEPYPQDVEKAKALVAEAGLEGKTMTLYFNSERVYMKETAQIIQQQLKNVGITLDVIPLESAGFFEKVFGTDSDYEFYLNGYGANGDPDNVIYGMFNGIWGVNLAISDELAAKWSDARSVFTDEERAALYKEIQEMTRDELTCYPIAYPNYVFVTTSNIKGTDTIKRTPIFEDYTKLTME